jgi:hypothetical protein
MVVLLWFLVHIHRLLNVWVSCILRINFSLSPRTLKRLKDVVLNIHEENEYKDKEGKQRVVNFEEFGSY